MIAPPTPPLERELALGLERATPGEDAFRENVVEDLVPAI
jgi:hypothetical protein